MPRQSILISGAARGWQVGALDRDATGLDRLAAALPDAVWTGTLDIADRDAVLAAVAAFGAMTGGRLDILHANAGIDAKGPLPTWCGTASARWSRSTCSAR